MSEKVTSHLKHYCESNLQRWSLEILQTQCINICGTCVCFLSLKNLQYIYVISQSGNQIIPDYSFINAPVIENQLISFLVTFSKSRSCRKSKLSLQVFRTVIRFFHEPIKL